jgi:hypothetical protein
LTSWSKSLSNTISATTMFPDGEWSRSEDSK